jgi:hypothetical protein
MFVSLDMLGDARSRIPLPAPRDLRSVISSRSSRNSPPTDLNHLRKFSVAVWNSLIMIAARFDVEL